MAKDKLKGGFSDEISAEDIAKKHRVNIKDINAQIKKGIKVEMEHVDDEDLAREISLDHLFEIPDYYTRLDKMENEAKKDMKEGTENITEFARRMRELAGLADGNQHKTLKTVQEGESSFENGVTFYAKDMTGIVNESKEVIPGKLADENDEFETHKFEQKTIEERADDKELYSLNENTIIVLDFLDDEEDKLNESVLN